MLRKTEHHRYVLYAGAKTNHKTGTMNARNVDLGITGMV